MAGKEKCRILLVLVLVLLLDFARDFEDEDENEEEDENGQTATRIAGKCSNVAGRKSKAGRGFLGHSAG
jgi:hypothetical protein